MRHGHIGWIQSTDGDHLHSLPGLEAERRGRFTRGPDIDQAVVLHLPRKTAAIVALELQGYEPYEIVLSAPSMVGSG